jgi:drug/metabolite transporter (DMT)-like permease
VKGAWLAASSAVAYGSLGVLAKVAYGEGWTVPSLLVARFGLAALCILPLALREKGSWEGALPAFLVGALGYAATTALYFPSIRLLPAALASFLLYLAPPIVAGISFFWLRERLGWRGALALALALAGLAMMSWGAFTGALSWPGVVLASGSAVAYALTTLASREVARRMTWARMSLCVALGALTSYLVFGAATGQLALPPSRLGILAALGIGTIAGGLALSLFMAALPLLGASRTSVISTLEPVSTLVLAMAFLAEIPDLLGIVGGALILAAAALVATVTHEEPPAAPASP